MEKKKSTYRTLFDLTHEAVFFMQLKTVSEICGYIRSQTRIHNLDEKEIGRIVTRVCTPYKRDAQNG